MASSLIDCAVALANVLARENEALAALDLAAAAAMLPEKTAATAAFAAAQARAEQDNTPLVPVAVARQVAARLTALAEDNRDLLERGIAVQGRLIGCIAKATPRATPSRYGATGALASDRTRPVAFSARA